MTPWITKPVPFNIGQGAAAAAEEVTYPQSMEGTADCTNNGSTLDTTNEHLGTGCLDFDGTNDYINADGLLTFCTTTGSISLWVNEDVSQEKVLLMIADASAKTMIEIKVRTDQKIGVNVKVADATKWEAASTNAAPSAGNWYHLVITHDGTAPKLYIDGTEGTTFTDSTDKTVWWDLTGADNVTIGCKALFNSGSRTDFFNGKLDSMCFWNTAISSSVVTELYNSGTGITIPNISSTAGIRAFYNCDSATVDNNAIPT